MERFERIHILIVAAGSGRRLGSDIPKQYLPLDDKKTILFHTVSAFKNCSPKDITVMVPRGDVEYCEEMLSELSDIYVAEGGKSRPESVYIGLKNISERTISENDADGHDIVLIHDGARPFVSDECIEACIEGVVSSGAALCAVPAKDTIHVVADNGEIVETPDRKTLYAAQTPQGFILKDIVNAYKNLEANGEDAFLAATDDVYTARVYGNMKVTVVNGSDNNYKITTKEDYQRALLEKR